MADVLNTDYAEGLVLPMEDESKIRQDWLETFRYEGPRQRVCYELKEFAAVCPFSGLPDTGIVWVEYIPKTKLVELKSLKYYFISYRNVGIFQEAVTARILRIFGSCWIRSGCRSERPTPLAEELTRPVRSIQRIRIQPELDQSLALSSLISWFRIRSFSL